MPTCLGTVCFHLFFYTRAMAFSRPVWEHLAVTETGVVTVVSRYQVATPSRTITARATGPKVITDSLMRTAFRTPERFSGADHRKRLRVQTVRIIYTMYSDFDHSNSLHTAICYINSRAKVPRNGFELHPKDLNLQLRVMSPLWFHFTKVRFNLNWISWDRTKDLPITTD